MSTSFSAYSKCNSMQDLKARHIKSQIRSPISLTSCTTQGKDCSDPRDQIYGLLGHADEKTRRDLHVDYSLPVEEVFEKFERLVLHRQHVSQVHIGTLEEAELMLEGRLDAYSR